MLSRTQSRQACFADQAVSWERMSCFLAGGGKMRQITRASMAPHGRLLFCSRRACHQSPSRAATWLGFESYCSDIITL